MKQGRLIVGISCIIMLGFFGWSISMAPATMAHGYYVTTAKFFVQGLIPWKDFNMMDLPLGTALLGIPYIFTGILCTGLPALILMMLMNTINTVLLGIILRNNHVKRIYLWSSILLYLTMVYSACGLNVCLEPFAVFFLLMALFGLYSPSRTKNVLGSLMVLCAIGCKIQVLAFIPALYIYTILPKTADHWHWKRGNVFIVSIITLLTLGSLGIMLYSGNPSWYHHLRLNLSPEHPEISHIIYNWLLLGARTSIFLLVPGLIFAKKISKGACKWITTSILATSGVAVLMIFGNDKSWAQLILPFLVLSFGITLQETGSKYKWVNVLFAIGFLFPSYLVYREFQKLEMGETKIRQEKMLDYLSSLTEKDFSVAIIPYKKAEYEIGAQVYSERNLLVHNPLNTSYGFIDWTKPDKELKDAQTADAVIFPSLIYFTPNKFSGIEPAPKWAVDLGEYTKNVAVTGNTEYAIALKNGYTENIMKRFEGIEEHDHEHNHKHVH